jgi:hypothetical protein
MASACRQLSEQLSAQHTRSRQLHDEIVELLDQLAAVNVKLQPFSSEREHFHTLYAASCNGRDIDVDAGLVHVPHISTDAWLDWNV